MSDVTPAGMAEYVTTDRVGPRVAGRVVEPGKADQPLLLSPDEAATALGEGVIVAKGQKLSGGFGDSSEKASGIHADIAAERTRYAAIRARGAGRTAPDAPAATAPAAEPAKAPAPPAGGKSQSAAAGGGGQAKAD